MFFNFFFSLPYAVAQGPGEGGSGAAEHPRRSIPDRHEQDEGVVQKGQETPAGMSVENHGVVGAGLQTCLSPVRSHALQQNLHTLSFCTHTV